MGRFVLFGLVVAIVATACGGNEPDVSDAAAGEILAEVSRLGPAVPTTEAPSDDNCVTVIEIDEYGFEAEVVRCDGEPTGGDVLVETAGTLEEWLGSEDARALATELRIALVEQSACDDPEVLLGARQLAARAPAEVQRPMQRAIAALQRSSRNCDTDLLAWQRGLEQALDELVTFAALVAEAPNG